MMRRLVIVDVSLSRAQALNTEAVVQLGFDPLVAKQACNAGLDFLSTHQETLAAKYPGFDLEALRALPTVCDRIVRLQYSLSTTRTGESVQVRELISVALEWRRRFMPIAESLALTGKLDAVALEAVQAGAGVPDNVNDVIRLVELLTPHASFVAELWSDHALEEANAAAEKALKTLKRIAPDSASVRASSDLRDRYATLVVHDHEMLRLAVAVITASYRQAEAIVGPIRGGAGRKAKPAPEETPVTPVTDVQPAA